MTSDEQALLRRFRQRLIARFGDRVERVVLFGSRARGDAGPDSDYDVAVFLRGLTGDMRTENFVVSGIAQDLLIETGAFIVPLTYAAGADRDPTPLMHELRREGVEI